MIASLIGAGLYLAAGFIIGRVYEQHAQARAKRQYLADKRRRYAEKMAARREC